MSAIKWFSVLVCVTSACGWSQIITSSIVGNVTDVSGGVVPGAQITAVNTGTGITVSATRIRWSFYQNREPSAGGYTLDDETIGLATWPVIDWKYGLDGSVLWECCFAGPPKNVWVDPNNTVSGGKQVHNLAALVMYPAFPGAPG